MFGIFLSGKNLCSPCFQTQWLGEGCGKGELKWNSVLEKKTAHLPSQERLREVCGMAVGIFTRMAPVPASLQALKSADHWGLQSNDTSGFSVLAHMSALVSSSVWKMAAPWVTGIGNFVSTVKVEVFLRWPQRHEAEIPVLCVSLLT